MTIQLLHNYFQTVDIVIVQVNKPWLLPWEEITHFRAAVIHSPCETSLCWKSNTLFDNSRIAEIDKKELLFGVAVENVLWFDVQVNYFQRVQQSSLAFETIDLFLIKELEALCNVLTFFHKELNAVLVNEELESKVILCRYSNTYFACDHNQHIFFDDLR